MNKEALQEALKRRRMSSGGLNVSINLEDPDNLDLADEENDELVNGELKDLAPDANDHDAVEAVDESNADSVVEAMPGRDGYKSGALAMKESAPVAGGKEFQAPEPKGAFKASLHDMLDKYGKSPMREKMKAMAMKKKA